MEIIALVQKMGKHKALKNLFLDVQEKWFKEIKRFFAESVTSLIKKLLNSIDPPPTTQQESAFKTPKKIETLFVWKKVVCDQGESNPTTPSHELTNWILG